MSGGDSSRSQPPPAECPEAAARTTIHSLGEDLLLAIFLRLPSLATLVRAALTCRAWRRAVASSPLFRRRFRALHPSPFLGLFLDAPGGATQFLSAPSFPSFVPDRHLDRDQAAAVRGGDFFLMSLQDRLRESPCWEMVDCRRGYVLLVNWDKDLLAVLNPLIRQSERVFDLVSEDAVGRYRGLCFQLIPQLLWLEEDPMSFRVVLLAHDKSRIRATVFSSDTGEWSVTPWVDVPVHSDSDYVNRWLRNERSMQADRILYWVYVDQSYLISLDAETMKFSVAELPLCLSPRFDIGVSKHGVTCIVFSDRFNIGVLKHARDDGSVERWVLDRVVPLDVKLQQILQAPLNHYNELSVLAVRDGYVYLATSVMFHDPRTPCWFMSLCLETMKLEKLFQRTFDSNAHPYIMAWSPSLVGNHGRFALEFEDAS